MNSITAFFRTFAAMIGKVFKLLWVIGLLVSLVVVASILNTRLQGFDIPGTPPPILLPVLMSIIIHYGLYLFGKKTLKEYRWQKLRDSQK